MTMESPAAQPDPTTGSGPEQEDSTQQTLPPTSNRSISRSCYPCNRKKIRCDKRDPCTACARSGRLCVFPPKGPRVRRSKRTIIQDMSSRISNLEKSLSRCREENTTSTLGPSGSMTATSGASVQPQPARQLQTGTSVCNRPSLREDIIVETGSSSQFFNEIIFSRVVKNEQDMESVLTTTHSSSPQQSLASPFNPLGILSSPSSSTPPATYHPAKHLAVKLWNIYVDNVEGCAGLKILHTPTDEVKVYSVINDPAIASLENLALCFAIYFKSTVSLDPAEARLILGQDQDAMLLQFKSGLEQALAHGDALDHPTLTLLQALAIYTVALRVRNRGKSIWILNGLAIRIAHSLGLHRDGARLGLSPFQSEVRRRLWWHLLSRESRAGEDYGLDNTNPLLLVSDVAKPANLDDSDLSPDMTELPEGKTGWTCMSSSLMGIEIAKTLQKLANLAAASTPSSPANEDERRQIIQELRDNTEKQLAHCNPVVPPQRLALLCIRFLIRKYDFVTKLQWILLQRPGGPQADFATEEHLTEALEMLEPGMFSDDGLLGQFVWTRRAFPQYHVTMYVLLHLCVKPESPNVDRAWAAVDALFADEVDNGFMIGNASKMPVLTALRAKAAAVREAAQGRRPTMVGSVGNSNGDASVGSAEERSDVSGGGPPVSWLDDEGVGTGLGLDSLMQEWPDWAAFVQGFQVEANDTFL